MSNLPELSFPKTNVTLKREMRLRNCWKNSHTAVSSCSCKERKGFHYGNGFATPFICSFTRPAHAPFELSCVLELLIPFSSRFLHAFREALELTAPSVRRLGLCDACLPDISYQVHLAKKTRPSRKRRLDPPLGLALEHPDAASGQQGLKCHPPLYKLLSNLPPGENDLQDGRGSEPVAPLLRRSQSLEHLSV